MKNKKMKPNETQGEVLSMEESRENTRETSSSSSSLSLPLSLYESFFGKPHNRRPDSFGSVQTVQVYRSLFVSQCDVRDMASIFLKTVSESNFFSSPMTKLQIKSAIKDLASSGIGNASSVVPAEKLSESVELPESLQEESDVYATLLFLLQEAHRDRQISLFSKDCDEAAFRVFYGYMMAQDNQDLSSGLLSCLLVALVESDAPLRADSFLTLPSTQGDQILALFLDRIPKSDYTFFEVIEAIAFAVVSGHGHYRPAVASNLAMGLRLLPAMASCFDLLDSVRAILESLPASMTSNKDFKAFMSYFLQKTLDLLHLKCSFDTFSQDLSAFFAAQKKASYAPYLSKAMVDMNQGGLTRQENVYPWSFLSKTNVRINQENVYPLAFKHAVFPDIYLPEPTEPTEPVYN